MKRFFSAILLMTLACSAFAQKYANGLVVDSVDPKGDAEFIRATRKKMDAIRKKENRPTVALVLCGGGAKGAAEVGAMKFIEELDIPIDMICGTSIGGLLGGMYAIGYDAAFLDSLMVNQDWAITLSDKVEPEYVTLYTRRFKSQYQLNVPFHYSTKDFVTSESDVKYSNRKAVLKLGKNKDASLDTQSGVRSLAASLPSGYVYGMHVNNLLSSYTVGYHDSLSFANLPTPFFCVATELVSCKEKNWGSGNLKTAMRSTMSIPGLFSPVRTNGMVLMDGGSRNNFPNDLARAMGADIIIGIDLTDAFLKYDEINNIGTVLSQYVTMLGKSSYDLNIEKPDVYIKPNLDGYNMLSFNKEAVDSMMARGYAAAVAKRAELESVKNRVPNASRTFHAPKAVDIHKKKVSIYDVVFDGISAFDAKVLAKKVGIRSTDLVDADMLNEAIQIIYATGAVEAVTYSLLGTKEPYKLVFNCSPAPVHHFGVGLRLDTEQWAEVGINFGLNTHKLAGPKLDVNARIGPCQKFDAKFMFDYQGAPTFNAQFNIANYTGRYNRIDDNYTTNRWGARYWGHEEKIYISANKWSKVDGQLGFRNIYKKLDSELFPILANVSPEMTAGNYFGVFVNADYNTYDSFYYPTKGMATRLGYTCDFLKSRSTGFKPVHDLHFDISGVINLGGSIVDLIPDFHWRSVFDAQNILDPANPNNNFSLMHRNYIGGIIRGRYIEQQIPFVGLNNISDCMLVENGVGYSLDHVAVLNLDLRVNVMKNLYVSALGGYAHMSDTMGHFFTWKDRKRELFGAAVQVGYNTIVGPVTARMHWCNRTGQLKENIGFIISMGFDLF